MLKLKRLYKEKNIHKVFEITLALKGLHALIEIIGGAIFLFVSQDFIFKIISLLTQEELTQDPKDFISNYLILFTQQFSISSQHFVALYLLSHGLIKGLLVVGLIKEKLWSYPLSILVFSLFSGYQIIRFTHTHSPWLLLLTLLDIIVIVLTWHEYNYMKRKHGKSGAF